MAKALTLATVFTAIDKMTGPVGKMKGSVTGLGATLRKVATAAAAASVAAGVAIGKASLDFAKKGDEIAKTSRMLGLSTDALQELRYAADLQGVSDEQLTQGMKLLNNQLGQLQAGEGTLYSSLKKTDPALAKRLTTVRDTDEAFNVLMESIAAETNVQKRAFIAQSAFGKSGQELIKFANGGADAIKGLRAEAHKYGAVISEEAALSSEAFDDSLSRLKLSLKGLAYQGLGLVVSKMQPMIQQAADWISANKQIIALGIEKVFVAVGKALDFIVQPGIISGLASLAIGVKAIGLATMIFGAGNPMVLAIAGIAALITLIVTNWDKITGFFDRMAGGKSAHNIPGRESSKYGDAATGYADLAPVSSTSTERSVLDVNFANPPAGTSFRQTGAAPGISVNLGPTIGGSR